jgi:hypothetical protein
MNLLTVLFVLWGLITVLFLGLVFYRSRFTRKEADWIPLSASGGGEQVIEKQKLIEEKSGKLDRPIRTLGWLWVLMLLVVVGAWFYHGIMNPPPIGK